jgi:DHA1 family tetracycline resistance protein-like MFS transporter
MKRATSTIFILIVTIGSDIMGMGLVLPVLPLLFVSGAHHEGFVVSAHWQNIDYGLAIAAWPLGLFFGAPLLGDLSDQWGRKPMIVAALLGSVCSYVLAVVAIECQWLAVFFISRFLLGVCGGSYATAQAMMIDLSLPEDKARVLSLLSLACSMGVVVGPLVTSIVTLPIFSSWFHINTPFIAAALLSFLNVIMAWIYLPSIQATASPRAISPIALVMKSVEVMQDKRTQLLLLAFFFMSLGWSLYVLACPMILHVFFFYQSGGIALFFVVLGLSNIFFVLCLQQKIMRMACLKKLCVVLAAVVALLIAFAIAVHTLLVQWLVVMLVPGVQVVFYAGVMTLLSNRVADHEQGKTLGGADAVAALAWLFSGAMLGLLMNSSYRLPIAISSVLVLVSALVLWYGHASSQRAAAP